MIVFLLFWLACGIFAAGAVHAQDAARYKDQGAIESREDLGFSLLWGCVGGPICAFVAVFLTGGCASGWSLAVHKTKAESELSGEERATQSSDRITVLISIGALAVVGCAVWAMKQ